MSTESRPPYNPPAPASLSGREQCIWQIGYNECWLRQSRIDSDLNLAASDSDSDSSLSTEQWLSKHGEEGVDRLRRALAAVESPAPQTSSPASAPRSGDGESYTYASTQATECACCGQRKHTPLRVDGMDGYVCLTCIDKKLEALLDAERERSDEGGDVLHELPDRKESGARGAAVVRVYIAGPMRGIAEHNYPAFHAAAASLRAKGHEVISPAEINADWANYDQAGLYRICLKRDIHELVECDAIYMLPGWHDSRGARVERHIAQTMGLLIVDQATQAGPVVSD